MDKIIINGGQPLKGSIEISGAKNAALPLMALALLTKETVTLTNVPELSDVDTMCQLLGHHGSLITRDKANQQLTINSQNITNFTAPYDIVRKMRASIWVLAPLISRFGQAKVSFPGGCALGARQVDLHIAVIEALGAKIEIRDGYLLAKAIDRLQATKFTFSKISVGATISAILAASLAEGQSIFNNCAIEPEISDLCQALQKMGVSIDGIGTNQLIINGRERLNALTHKILPDRIEAGTYMIAAAITRGDIILKNIQIDILANIISKLELAGVAITETKDGIRVSHQGEIKPVNIATNPYPEFSTDLQAQFMTLMSVATGDTIIEENIFENRFMHVPELCRMGANITINGRRAEITGIKKFKGAEVMASDLRASVSLVIAGLAASGTTIINRIYHLDRGYEKLEEKLANCGADIRRSSK